MTKRVLPVAASVGLSIALLVLLFRVQNITLGDVGHALAITPPILLATVFALTFGNQVAGVVRWRAANAWLSPAAPRMSFLAMAKATAWGAFLGQLVPPQFSMSFARWAAMRHSSAVGVTLYEGLFDFVVLTSGGVAALAVLALGAGSAMSLLLFVGAILVGCISVRWMMACGHAFAGRYFAFRLPGSALAERLGPALNRASRAPGRTLALLCFWSFVRMALLALRALLVAVAFLPHLRWSTVLVGYPAVGLAVSVPFLPAGLGLAEWSWTGLLALAGAAAPAAAVTAVMFRIINFVAICGVTLVISLLDRPRGIEAADLARAPH